MSAPPRSLPRYAYASPENAARYAKDTAEGFYDLLPAEVYWRDRYFFLVEHGYTLRPRYHPEWTPSWIGTNLEPMFCEDYIILMVSTMIVFLGRYGGLADYPSR